MSTKPVSRRDAVKALGIGAAAMSTTGASSQTSASRAPLSRAFAGDHQPKPLKFDPAKLDGLSERLIKSHWENNYTGSVKAPNLVENRLAAALPSPGMAGAGRAPAGQVMATLRTLDACSRSPPDDRRQKLAMLTFFRLPTDGAGR